MAGGVGMDVVMYETIWFLCDWFNRPTMFQWIKQSGLDHAGTEHQ